jgi:hypothetical protein
MADNDVFLRAADGTPVELIAIKSIKLRRGGKDYMESIPWFSNGKEWFVERSRIASYLK